jgi:hypothetical protein
MAADDQWRSDSIKDLQERLFRHQSSEAFSFRGVAWQNSTMPSLT